ncbi:transcription elongation factor GreA [Patescibacteria group bacterium]|nr:transcription elongation factor GreA [Patescibacteria group bacterium]
MNEVYYVSKEGIKVLEEELERRSGELRRSISDKIGVAKDQGDLSENFEYQDAKEEQAQNETRIIQIKDMLARAVVVEKQEGGDRIQLGSRFIVKLPNGSDGEFEIVGGTESDPMSGKISNESPLGNAFLGKMVGEIAEVQTPGGAMQYTVISIT